MHSSKKMLIKAVFCGEENELERRWDLVVIKMLGGYEQTVIILLMIRRILSDTSLVDVEIIWEECVCTMCTLTNIFKYQKK